MTKLVMLAGSIAGGGHIAKRSLAAAEGDQAEAPFEAAIASIAGAHGTMDKSHGAGSADRPAEGQQEDAALETGSRSHPTVPTAKRRHTTEDSHGASLAERPPAGQWVDVALETVNRRHPTVPMAEQLGRGNIAEGCDGSNETSTNVPEFGASTAEARGIAVEQTVMVSMIANPNSPVELVRATRIAGDRSNDQFAAVAWRRSEAKAPLPGELRSADDAGSVRLSVVKQETHFPVARQVVDAPAGARTSIADRSHTRSDVPSRLAADHLPSEPRVSMRDNATAIRFEGLKSERTDLIGASALPAAQVSNAILDAAGTSEPERTAGSAPAVRPDNAAAAPAPVKVLHLHLSPMSLGLIKIELASDATALRIRIDAEHLQTATSLDREQDVLTDRLTAAGYRVDELVVASSAAPVGVQDRPDQSSARGDQSGLHHAATHGQGERSGGENRARHRESEAIYSNAASIQAVPVSAGKPAAIDIARVLGKRSFGAV